MAESVHPGTTTATSYSYKVLNGNWNEEQFDTAFVLRTLDERPRIPSDWDALYASSYRAAYTFAPSERAARAVQAKAAQERLELQASRRLHHAFPGDDGMGEMREKEARWVTTAQASYSPLVMEEKGEAEEAGGGGEKGWVRRSERPLTTEYRAQYRKAQRT